MNTQHISNSQTVINSVTNQSTTTPENLTATDTLQSQANNATNGPKGHSSSDWDIFGDDDEFIQALETDGSAWLAFSGAQQTLDSGQRKTAIEELKLENSNEIIEDTDSAQVDEEGPQSDAMLISDHYADLPSSPGFSLDELPIFSKQNTVDTSIQPNETVDLIDITGSTSGAVPTEIQLEDIQVTDVVAHSVSDKPATDEEAVETMDHHVAEQMDMLDILDSPSPPSSLPNVSDVDPPTVDSGQSSDTSSAPISRFKLSLRQRNAIQLHPFTIEQANFHHLIGRSSMKGKIKASISTQTADSQDTEFTLSDTQLADVPTDELQESQMRPESSRKPASKGKAKKTSLPSKSSKGTKDRPRASNVQEITFDDMSSPVFDKYGLDKLVLPTISTSASKKEKPKTITFQRKRRSKKGKTVARKFLPSSSAPRTKDIFDFDAQPRSAFNFAARSSEAASSSDPRAASSDTDDYNNDDDAMDHNDDDDDEDDMEVDNEETIKRRFRIKKHAILDSSDEEEEEESLPPERELTEAELDAIFSFPGTSALTSTPGRAVGRRLTQASPEDDVVPIVEDAMEHREHKRQRVGLQDVLKKKKTLRSVLPASFLKIYQKELQEEDKLRKAPRKRTANATANKSSTATTSSSTRQPTAANRADPDVFGAFLGSQSEDSDEDSDDMQDAYPTLDDYVTRLDYATQIPTTRQHQTGPVSSTSDILGFFEGSAAHSPRQSHAISRSSSSSGLLRQAHLNAGAYSHPQSVNKHVYPAEESIEDNRIQRYPQGTSTRKATKPVRRAPRSSLAIKRPANPNPRKPSRIPIRDNPAPKKRRKKVRRTRDDIYCHAPYSYRAWNDRSGQAPDNNGRTQFQKFADTPRMAFDDIYVGTRQHVRYAIESLNGERFNELFDQKQNEQAKEKLNVLVIHTLPNVISRVRHLQDYDLRRISGLKDTVYLQHHLLAPLLSATPNLKSAYKHLQGSYADLTLFDKHLLWKNVVPENERLIGHLFYKVSGDLERVCKDEFPLDDNELPGHDHFYTFVSVCLTQWIPLHPYEDRVQLTEIFMRYTRYLGRCVPQLVEERKSRDLAWRPIVKLMVYILDWTCRLHHLGVHQIDWSVTRFTKSLIDVLVFIGFDDIKSCTRDYLAEAWICLLQIMSVSSKTSGFYFHEQVFLDQMTESIKTKSKDLGEYEFEKRKTTRLWAETLNLVIEKYMLL